MTNKIIILLLATLMLASCSMPTEAEIEEERKRCTINGQDIYINEYGDIFCRYTLNPVMKCIEEYTNGIDEKYNNPDTVTNLREDNYSNVVKTCNEIFGNKNNNEKNN